MCFFFVDLARYRSAFLFIGVLELDQILYSRTVCFGSDLCYSTIVLGVINRTSIDSLWHLGWCKNDRKTNRIGELPSPIPYYEDCKCWVSHTPTLFKRIVNVIKCGVIVLLLYVIKVVHQLSFVLI